MEKLKFDQEWIVAEVDVVYKSVQKSSRKITSSDVAYKAFESLWDMNKIDYVEQCRTLFLDRQNKIICSSLISTGGLASTVVDVRVIFATALKVNASGLILCHNHPAGTLVPSEADLKLTNKIKNAGKLLDIELLDHLIITSENYLSLSDMGLIV